ncbi:N-acetylneuraminate synthase family protein [Thalassospira australica]|uniref:N-acetylneuraminate synthase family protein n=1 Tax=Thalassospira australica TaxID=1528106 RepID=UPI00384B5CA5
MNFKHDYHEPKVVAEIGCNHMGDIRIAKELIWLAKESGARYVKFQKRNNRELLTKEQYDSPHPVPANSYGKTYGEHREFLELNKNQNQDLKRYCEEIGVTYSTSVWDLTSAQEIIELNPEFIKVPSACNNNIAMLKALRDDYRGGVQISIGMTTKSETDEIIRFFEEADQASTRLVIYSCTSGYPVPSKDVSLLEINWLYQRFGNRVSEIGFSGHHLGTSLDIAAYTLGARWIERHFTKDKTWKGTDHAASLEPNELSTLVNQLSEVHSALNYKSSEILPIEQIQRDKLKNRK